MTDVLQEEEKKTAETELGQLQRKEIGACNEAQSNGIQWR